jgi:hypothetical protein
MNNIPPRIMATDRLRRSQHFLIAATGGFVFWWAFSMMSAVEEPWDGLYYWSAAFPGSLLLSAAFGFAFRRDPIIAGVSVTFAQLPLIVVNAGFEGMVAAGAIFLGLLSIPAVLAALVGTTIRGLVGRQDDADRG